MDKETNKQFQNLTTLFPNLLCLSLCQLGKKKKQFPNDKEDKLKFNPAFNY